MSDKDDFDPDYQTREAEAVEALKGQIPEDLQVGIAGNNFVVLSNNFRVHPNHYKATAVDGPGTKPILAIVTKKFDTIGIEPVAMTANDMATLGNVELDDFLNYLPCQFRIEEEKITAEIMKGIVEGCRQAGITRIGKGETASVDEMLGSPKEGYGFDIGGVLIGYVGIDELPKRIESGMLIIGFRSSGVHCNGFTVLRLNLLTGDFEERPQYREQYKGRYSLDDRIMGAEQTIGEMLLEPTMIYSGVMKKIGKRFPYVQGVNITGYGLHNFNRVGSGVEYHITDPFEPHPIFELYQSETGESDEKMHKSFNMGLGFAFMVDVADAEKAMDIASESGFQVQIVGEVRKSDNPIITTYLHKDGKELTFEGYQ